MADDPVPVEFDHDVVAVHAKDLDIAHALDALKGRAQDIVGRVVKIAEIAVELGHQEHDGYIVLIPSPDPDLFDIIGQFEHDSVHAVAEIRVGHPQIGIGLEADPGVHHPGVTTGADLLDVVDCADDLLDRPGELFLDVLGSGVA